MPVEGDCAGIDHFSRTTGGSALHAQAQATTYGSTLSLLNPLGFQGGKADAARAFTRQMQVAAQIAARSYDQVASFLPRVSAAIRTAQADQRTLDQATARLTQARSAADAATAEVVAAKASLQAAQAALATARVVGALGAAPHTAGEQAAVRAAQQRLAAAQAPQHRAQDALDKAERARQKASQAFDDADRERRSILSRFQYLCDSEAAVLERALPSAMPAPTFVSMLQQQSLEASVPSLLVLPAAVYADASCGLPVRALQRMTAHQDYAGILRSFRTLYPPPAPAPKPASHHWYDGALHVVDAVGHFFGHDVPRGAEQFADGAKDAAVGIGTGFASQFEQALNRADYDGPIAQLMQQNTDRQTTAAWIDHFPNSLEKSVENAVGVGAFRHGVLYGLGSLVPTIVAAVLTKGTGSALKTTELDDGALRVAASNNFRDALDAPRPDSERLVADGLATLRRSRELEPTLARLRNAEGGLKIYGHAGTVIGVNTFLQDNGAAIEACTPYSGDGLLPDWLADKGASKVTGFIMK